MTVKDIYKCGNVFETFTNVIINDSYTRYYQRQLYERSVQWQLEPYA